MTEISNGVFLIFNSQPLHILLPTLNLQPIDSYRTECLDECGVVDYLRRILNLFLSLVEIAFVVSRISKIDVISFWFSTPKYSPAFNVSNDMANNTPQST